MLESEDDTQSKWCSLHAFCITKGDVSCDKWRKRWRCYMKWLTGRLDSTSSNQVIDVSFTWKLIVLQVFLSKSSAQMNEDEDVQHLQLKLVNQGLKGQAGCKQPRRILRVKIMFEINVQFSSTLSTMRMILITKSFTRFCYSSRSSSTASGPQTLSSDHGITFTFDDSVTPLLLPRLVTTCKDSLLLVSNECRLD